MCTLQSKGIVYTHEVFLCYSWYRKLVLEYDIFLNNSLEVKNIHFSKSQLSSTNQELLIHITFVLLLCSIFRPFM